MSDATRDEVPSWDTVVHRLSGTTLAGSFRVHSEVGRDEQSLRLVGSTLDDARPVAIDVIDLAELVAAASGRVGELMDELDAARRDAVVPQADLLNAQGSGWLDSDGAETRRGTRARWFWVATELRAGGSLQQIMDRGRRLSPSQAVVLGFHLARGLAALHERGIVHGALHPAMVRFGTDGRVGLAGAGWSGVVATWVWSRDVLIGIDRARYAAPELATEATPSAATDVYALCMVLVEAVTGVVPLSTASVSGTMAARQGHLLPVSAELGALAPVLERAGRPDPQERLSAQALAEALVRCAEGMARPDPLPIVTDDSAGLERPAVLEATPDPRFASVGETPGENLVPTGSESPPTTESFSMSSPEVATPAEPTPETAADPAIQARPGRRRRLVLSGLAAAAVVVVLAIVVVRAFETPSHTVPELVGVPGPQVANLVGEFGWQLEVRRERSDDVDEGEVIRTDPGAGVDLDEGSAFVVVVSEGPTLSELPELLGRDGDAAVDLLRSLGLAPVVTAARHDEDIPAGAVLTWFVTGQPSLLAGASVVKGAEVTLETSLGPAPRDVPDVVTLAAAEAVAALEDLGLVAELAEDFSDEIPAGDVAAQSPLPGESVPKGSSVLVVVSRGPDVVVVPEVDDLDHDEVLGALTEADLQIGTVTGDVERRLLGLSIEGTAIGVGERVPRGAVVDLVYEFAL